MRVLKYMLGALVILSALALWKREELMRLHAVVTLFDEGRIVQNFSRMDRLFETAPIPVSGEVTRLPEGPPLDLPADWQDWLDRRAVTAVLILRDGRVVHEAYHRGTGADDQRISWSIAKSYLSGLFGVMVAKGHVDNLDAPVTDHVPALKGTAYDGVTIRNVLQMSSGVTFDEDYLDFWSDINKMGRILALGGSMDGFAADLQDRDRPAGEVWDYVSIDTHVLGMVLRSATGQSLPDLLGEHILGPLGTTGNPSYITDGYGVAFALGGLNLTLRDYARMGEMFRQDGRFRGRQIVPAAWVAESTTPSARTAPGQLQYGYQWWMPADARDGEFLARGIYGQYVYIDKQSGTVVAVTGADLTFRESGAFDDSLQMFRVIAAMNEEAP